MHRPRSPWPRFAVVAAIVALDLWSKAAVFDWMRAGPEGVGRDLHGHARFPLVGDWFGFMLSCNPGAAFGRFGDYPYVLVLGRVAAVGLLAWLLWRSNGRPRLALWAMVLVLAGALGNLIDNLGLGCREEGHPFGLVRDFIDVWFRSEAWGWDWHFPTFNVADSCITVGAVLWVLSGFVHRAEPEPAPEPPDAEDAADPTERSALAPAGRPSAE